MCLIRLSSFQQKNTESRKSEKLKTAGAALAAVSVMMIMAKRILRDYMSLVFLTDTIALIQHITVNIQSGKTYIQMFEDIGYGFYRKLSFENINGFVSSLKCNGLVYKEYIYLAEKFLLSAGRHPMEEELLYLNNNLEAVKKAREDRLEIYKNNRKSDITASVSTGLILFILLI